MSLRTKGEAISGEAGDRFVAPRLAMTEQGSHCEPKVKQSILHRTITRQKTNAAACREKGGPAKRPENINTYPLITKRKLKI